MTSDREDLPAPRRGLVGRLLGDRYRVTNLVSAGANTLIADADDLALGRAVTIKLVRPEWAESETFRGTFDQEMRKISALSHPNLAAVHDWGEEVVGKRTTVYTVVEHLSGGSLRDLLDRGRSLDPSQALLLGLEACRGLDFAHRQGLVHSELTPSKLVFGDDRRLRIVDFGLARLLGERGWRELATLPTHVARYAAPEQALAQPISDKTDLYALALILIEAVTHEVPFAARSTVATLSARVGRLMPVSADLGPLASVLERAGRPEPADRGTAAELGRGLVAVAGNFKRPSPIPIIVSRIDDDPQRLRRPNDPTGGIVRPPAERASAVVPPTAPMPPPAPPTAPTPSPAAPAAPFPEDVDGPTGATTTPAAAAPPPAGEPGPEVDPEPAPPTSGPEESAAATADERATEPSPNPGLAQLVHPTPSARGRRVYDGDEDVTKDELAKLATAPVEPTVDAPASAVASAPASDSSVGEGGPRRRRWLTALFGLLVLAALAGLGALAVVLFRAPTHPVPDVEGETLDEARALITDFDWEVEVTNERSDEQPVEGAIIRTEPAAGKDLGEGEPFLIVLSEGPEFRDLPELTGETLADAETELAELQLTALPPTEAYDETVPTGSVISWSVPTDPTLAAGGDVLPDAEVALVVSQGPTPRVVPDFTGLTAESAETLLAADRLELAVAEPVFSDTVPSGEIVSADPVAGTSVERDSVVTVVPSKGIDYVVFPDLAGLTLAQTRAALAEAGLQVGTVIGNSQGRFALATYLDRDLTAGGRIKRDTAVDLAFV